MTHIGAYQAYSIETGRFRLDGGAMFGIIPRALWERRLPPDDRNRVELSMRCLLLEGAGRLVLVDAGLGHKYDDKFADIYGVDHTELTLDRSLRQAGFSRDQITDVILTHLHFDHCGGAVERQGDQLKLAFPNATHHVQRRHWEWAVKPNERERGSFLSENLEPLEASGRMALQEGPGELFPGIHTYLVNGHTEAQQLVRVDGDETSLLFAADLLPTHAHIPSVWVMAYDVRPLLTMEEKARVLDEAVEKRWTLFFEHDPQVEIAEVIHGNRGYEPTGGRRLVEL